MLLIALALGACSSGSSDNGPPPNTKTTANVSNQTTSNFASVSIEEHATGKTFYSGAFDCAAKQTDCKLYYTGSDITGPAVLLFKDAQGHVVGIYDVDNAPGSYMAPEVTLWTTGAYLYEVLVNQNAEFKNMPEAERQAALNVFVSEKDALEGASPIDVSNPLSVKTDHYEELALNYFNKQSSGSMTVAAYVDDLGKRLIKREVAPSSEFILPANFAVVTISSIRYALVNRFNMIQGMDLIGTAHAQTSSSACSQGLGIIMALFQGATQGIPAAFPIAGVAFKAAGAVGFAACNTTVVRLDDIINKLVIVQNSLDNLSDDVGKLTNFVASVQTNTNLQDFTTVSSDLSTLAGQYQVILGNSKASSLKDYVQKVGGSGPDGLKNVLSKEPDGVFAKLLGRLPATTDQSYLLQIQRLTENQFDSLLLALDLLCKNPSTGDVIKQRVQCNLVIATSSSRLLAAQAIAYQLASDTYDLLEAYPTEATRYGYDRTKSATENKVALKAKFDKQSELMALKYNSTVQNSDGTSGVYNTFDGLPAALLTSIAAANCNGNQLDLNARVQAITGWVKQGRNEYIVTNCKNFVTPVLARYYLKVDGSTVNSNDVSNIMGVLAPFSTANRAVDNNVLSFSSGAGNFASRIFLVLQNAPVPYTFAVNSNTVRTRWFFDELFPGGPDSEARLAKNTGDKRDASLPSWIDQLIANRDGYLDQGGWPNYIRYTHQNGYSIVFIAHLQANGTMQNFLKCITDDCSYGNLVSINNYLKFKDGPETIQMGSYPAGSSNKEWFYINGKDIYH